MLLTDDLTRAVLSKLRVSINKLFDLVNAGEKLFGLSRNADRIAAAYGGCDRTVVMADATGPQASLPATPRLPMACTLMIRQDREPDIGRSGDVRQAEMPAVQSRPPSAGL
ncbi:MAG: hypothetical protein DMF63_08640 [Acidobacteria bacterium]|nr:MAG: hypothetical protein DMF63_08640 [Acidobacteriota bacterium]